MKTRSIAFLSGLIAATVMSGNAFANVDLKKNMQNITFKQAAEAQSIEEMQKTYRSFRYASGRAKNRCVPSRKENFMEGFKKISLSIDSIEQKLDQGIDFEAAKQELRD
ncbi:cytochrome b562 [Vibrio chagasii]|nr:cytochrome b562 [Vibrio chagasii]